MRVLYPAPAQVESRIVGFLRNNYRLHHIVAMEGMPSKATITKWRLARPGFRQAMDEARAEGRGMVRIALADGFDPVRAEAFLARVRLGDAMGDLLWGPDGPGRERLNRWKVAHPAFAAALAEAKRGGREARRARRSGERAYDEATGDRIVAGLWKGTPLKELVKDPSLPGIKIVNRWRREVPEFDTVIRQVVRAAGPWRARRRVLCTPELTERVAARIEMGASLSSLSREPGMPSQQTLYRWVRTRPAFAAAVRAACGNREHVLYDQAVARLNGMTPAQIATVAEPAGIVVRRVSRMEPWPGERRRGNLGG